MFSIQNNFTLREKCPNMEFFLVCIFLYWDWIWTDTLSFHIQSEYRKIRTRKTPYLDTFHAAFVNLDRFSPVNHSHLLKKSLTRSFISLRCGYSRFKNLRNIFRIQWNMYRGVFCKSSIVDVRLNSK